MARWLRRKQAADPFADYHEYRVHVVFRHAARSEDEAYEQIVAQLQRIPGIEITKKGAA